LHEGTPGRRRTAERYETAAADTAMYTAKTAGRDCVRHAENSHTTRWSSPDTTR